MDKNSNDQSLGKSLGIFVISLLFGIGGLLGTASLFEMMKWPYLHGWGIMHGPGPLCIILFWAFIGYHLTKLVFHSGGQFSPIPNLAFTFSALGTILYSRSFVWLGILGVLFSSIGAYIRLHKRRKDAAGLMWTGLVVGLLSLAYWGYNARAMMKYMKR
jgi:hypothetical protein